MPIRPEFRHFYRGAAWLATRARILARANNRCEQCGKPNRVKVWVVSLPEFGQIWQPPKLQLTHPLWIKCTDGRGYHLSGRKVIDYDRSGRLRHIRVVLTIAHLNHVAGDDRDENLKALCQWCHLNYDKLHHRESRAVRKDRSRPLLEGAA